MKVKCPNCDNIITINGLGRKPLNISLKNICESLISTKNIKDTARELHCSEGYVYNTLKVNGLKLKEVIAEVPC